MTGKTTVFSPTVGDVVLPLDEAGNMSGNIGITGGGLSVGGTQVVSQTGNISPANGVSGNLVSGNHSITFVNGVITAVT